MTKWKQVPESRFRRNAQHSAGAMPGAVGERQRARRGTIAHRGRRVDFDPAARPPDGAVTSSGGPASANVGHLRAGA
jgi:hypothetical protein